MTALVAQLAQIGGDTYILSGCVKTGSNVSDGYVVVNGEIMPFVGGTLQATVFVNTQKASVVVGTNTYQDVYTDRKMQFGLGAEQYNWASRS